MLTRFVWIFVVAVFGLSGCGLVRNVDQADPREKLVRAEAFFTEKDKPRKAEPLIVEAMATARRTNDYALMAEAYRTYALFFRSDAVAGAENHYRRKGFLMADAEFDRRLEVSLDYLRRSASLYNRADQNRRLPGTYVDIALSYEALSLMDQACESLDIGANVREQFGLDSVGDLVTPPRNYCRTLPADWDCTETGYMAALKSRMGCWTG